MVVVTTAGCDDPMQIDQLARLVERGVVVAAASRYSRGAAGRQPTVEGHAVTPGRSQPLLAGARGHARRHELVQGVSTDFVRQVGIESDAGFEVGLELVAKARRLRLPVAELPTIWLDRSFGVSNFKLAQRIPKYLHWWMFAFGPKLSPNAIRHDTRSVSVSTVVVAGSAGFIGGYVLKELLQRGHSVIGLDNFSKYGPVSHSYDDDPRYRFVEVDARDVDRVEPVIRLALSHDHEVVIVDRGVQVAEDGLVATRLPIGGAERHDVDQVARAWVLRVRVLVQPAPCGQLAQPVVALPFRRADEEVGRIEQLDRLGGCGGHHHRTGRKAPDAPWWRPGAGH